MTCIPSALCFDAENIIAPESAAAVFWQAEILAEYGLTGSFMIVGERARVSGPADAPYTPEADAIAPEHLLEQARLQCWALKPAWP